MQLREVRVTILVVAGGVGLIAIVLWEGFETVVLPRRVTRRFRLTRLFYRATWHTWAAMVRTAVPGKWQETWLSVFGPISILLLLSIWACGLIFGFALLYWAAGDVIPLHGVSHGFLTVLYLSGTTFFTLGLGDVVARSALGHGLVVIESGMGFAFLALIIAYLPALNQFFARRETDISLLDARAGSPPTAGELLRRHSDERGIEALRELLLHWEHWSAEFLEGHLSYPILAYFRSQHDNESWLAALTAILDTCSWLMAGGEKTCKRQAELTLAMARHAVVDLCLVFRIGPRPSKADRLPPAMLGELRAMLAGSGLKLETGEQADDRLSELRKSYEPYLESLATYFQTHVPPWMAASNQPDNWQGNIRDRLLERKHHKRRTGEHF